MKHSNIFKSVAVLICSAIVSAVPISSYAYTYDDNILYSYSAENKLSDSDILLSEYLYKTSGIETDNTKLPHASGRKALDGWHTAICEMLGEKVKQMASGALSDTSVFISGDDITRLSGYSQTIQSLDINALEDALLDEYAYELYWFDKTESLAAEGYNDITFSFPVSSDYSLTGEKNTYKIDTNKTSAASRTVENAKAIVNSVDKNASDFEAMMYFKDQICNLTSYNTEASENKQNYGDPWQIIYVFDGDPSTNVVCEGYSKAFKYLCDLYSFHSDITCICAEGFFSYNGSKERHMWNIVSINKTNYLIDITNSDSESIGNGGELFFAYAPPANQLSFTNGMYAGVDIVINGKKLRYEYTSSTINTYEENEIKISEKPLVIHKVLWENSDGTVLEECSNVADGELPVYHGSAPVSPDGGTFDGWTPNPATPIQSTDEIVRYTAEYYDDSLTHTVTFMLGDIILKEMDFDHEDTVGLIDVKTENCKFEGWYTDSALQHPYNIKTKIKRNISLYAKITYHASWKDDVGNVLYESDVLYGDIPVYNGSTPKKQDDKYYKYSFSGWSSSTTEPNIDITYTACFDKEDKYYTVTWKNSDGKILEVTKYKYGDTPSFSGETPQITSANSTKFLFSGWTPNISKVFEDSVYTAEYTMETIVLLYGDIDSDGSVDSSDALSILRSSVGLKILSDSEFIRADVDKNMSVDSSDALAVLRYSVGMADSSTFIGTTVS